MQFQAKRLAEHKRLMAERLTAQQAKDNPGVVPTNAPNPGAGSHSGGDTPEAPVKIEVSAPTDSPVIKPASVDSAAAAPSSQLGNSDASGVPAVNNNVPSVAGTDGNSQASQNASPLPSQTASQPLPVPHQVPVPKQPQEYVDDILNILKTAFPLLALSMEKMVDHISVRAKTPNEEEIFRVLSVLLENGISVS